MARKKWFKIFTRSRKEPISEQDFARYLGGGETWAGMDIDRTTVLGISAVYAAVRIISETIGSLPLITYRRIPGGKERAENHHIYDLLHLSPNPEQTPMQFKETMQGHICLLGNAYAYKVLNGRGEVTELWPLDPEKMRMKRISGKLKYIYTRDGEETRLSRDEIFHVAGMGYDGMMGYAPLEIAKNTYGQALAMHRFGSEFFKNSGTPGGYISLPQGVKLQNEAAITRLKSSWEDKHKDWGNKHRIGVLENGGEFKTVTIPPEHAQFIQTMKFSVTDIARIYRLPPPMLADLERSTYSNIEFQGIEFIVHSMGPWFVRWEQTARTQLVPDRDRSEIFSEFLVNALLKGDIKSRYEAYRIGREIGVLSGNEIRAFENMNPVDGGDELYVPLNWMPLTADQSAGMEEQQQNSRAAVRAKRAAQSRHTIASSFNAIFEDAIKRILNKEIKEIRKNGVKQLKIRDIGDFDFWLDQFYGKLPDFIRSTMVPTYMSFAAAIKSEVADELGGEGALSDRDIEYVGAFVTVFISRYVGKSLSDINKMVERSISEGIDVVEELEKTLDKWDQNRAIWTARNETVRGSNAFARNMYLIAGIRTLRWVAIGKSCPFCLSMDGSVVGIETDFVVPGDVVDADGGEMGINSNIGHPPLHRGCDCQIIAV